MPYMCSMGYRVCREYSTAVDLSLLVVECAMELALDIIGECFTRCLSRHICRVTCSPSGDRYIDIYINHGGQVARLPVSYTSSLSFCHSSHVVVYFILLSVVCSRLFSAKCKSIIPIMSCILFDLNTCHFICPY